MCRLAFWVAATGLWRQSGSARHAPAGASLSFAFRSADLGVPMRSLASRPSMIDSSSVCSLAIARPGSRSKSSTPACSCACRLLPCRSLLFELPGLRTLSRHKAYTRHQLTMCAFGTRWRKATKLWCWYCEGHYLDTCRCTGRSGICSFSKKPHIQLQGKSDSGPNWTTIASAYPPRLCHFTARMMATAALDRATADPGILWKKRKPG